MYGLNSVLDFSETQIEDYHMLAARLLPRRFTDPYEIQQSYLLCTEYHYGDTQR
jgi:hypothetical protein